MKNAIEIVSVSKSFKDTLIIDDVSFNIERGEVHALIGPNGSGKTTLLRLITSLYTADSGSVVLNGKHSMLLENDYLYEEKTGTENIILFGKYFNYDSKPTKYKLYSDILNLSEHLEKRASTYSKGMKRKLSLLIVMLMNSEIILLDEPTSGVDPISRIEIRKLLDILKEQGRTILITSHDLSEIEKVADRVTMIKDGVVLFTKTISQLEGKSLEEVFVEEGLHEKYK